MFSGEPIKIKNDIQWYTYIFWLAHYTSIHYAKWGSVGGGVHRDRFLNLQWINIRCLCKRITHWVRSGFQCESLLDHLLSVWQLAKSHVWGAYGNQWENNICTWVTEWLEDRWVRNVQTTKYILNAYTHLTTVSIRAHPPAVGGGLEQYSMCMSTACLSWVQSANADTGVSRIDSSIKG